MHGAYAPGRAIGRLARAEADRVHDLGGAVEALVGLVERAGVGEEPRERDRVRGLHQQRARPDERDDGLAVHEAQHRVVCEVSGPGHRWLGTA